MYVGIHTYYNETTLVFFKILMGSSPAATRHLTMGEKRQQKKDKCSDFDLLKNSPWVPVLLLLVFFTVDEVANFTHLKNCSSTSKHKQV